MELSQLYGFDLVITPNSQLELVDGAEQTYQRILRRLMTNPGQYLFAPDYGAGLGLYVGQNLTVALEHQIKGVITKQMFKEDTVAQSPRPVISLSQNGSQLIVSITYAVKPSGLIYTLSFTAGA